MKLKQLLTKTLLVVAFLGVGSMSAWAETSTVWKTYKSWTLSALTAVELQNYTGLTNSNNQNKTFYLNTSPFTVDNTDSQLYGLIFEGPNNRGGFNTTTAAGDRGFILGGAAAKITIPNLKKGQRVTVTTTTNAIIASEQLSDVTSKGSGVSTGIVKDNGNVVIVRSDATNYVASILVESPSTQADATVKMTYVNYDDKDRSYGEIATGATAETGFNKISNGTVGFDTPSWGVNYITYLQVDASALPNNAVITSATLTFQGSGSAGSDKNRASIFGAGYNSSVWSSTMTYNTANRSITTVGTTYTTTSKKYATFETVNLNITDAIKNDDDKIATVIVYETAADHSYIKNPSVKFEYSTVANYAVKYYATIGGVKTEIKDQTSLSGAAYSTCTITDAEKADIIFNNWKYTYSSDDASTNIIAADGGTVVEVTFNAAPAYTYTVVDNLGNELASGSSYAGENINYYVPYYVFQDGRFYTSPSVSSGTLSYGQGTISSISANTEIIVTYTEETNTNVVYFSEAEYITGASSHEDGYTRIRMSNGKAGYFGTQTAFAHLPAGIYTLTAATRSGTTKFYAGTVGSGKEVHNVSSSGSVVSTTSSPFILETASDIYTSVGNSGTYFDFVIIRKTGEVAAIGETGYATFSSTHAIDFTGVTEATPYIVTGKNGDKVTLEPIEGMVAAGTGLILKSSDGNAAKIGISWATSGSWYNSTTDPKNYLFAVDSNYDLEAKTDGSTNYVLALQGGNVVFAPIAETPAPVTAGHAALWLPADAGSARTLSLSFDSDATGIQDVKSIKTNDAAIFNINGQRINNPVKGQIYIVDGKKMVKN